MTLHRVLLILAVLLPARQTEGQIGDGPRRKQVLAEITAASARARGVVSVAALNLETNERVSLNADRPVFMSSVVKLPIAVQLLATVERVGMPEALCASARSYGRLSSRDFLSSR